MRSKIRVVVVDDSRVARETIRHIINKSDDAEVVGEAADALQAREVIKQVDPDVITLDIEMPGMSGLKFLKNLIRLRPMPVVMISSLTQRGAEVTFEALDIGAVDFVAKPTGTEENYLENYAESIMSKLRAAVQVPTSLLRLKRDRLAREFEKKRASHERVEPSVVSQSSQSVAAPPQPVLRQQDFGGVLVAIGASTGGPEALKRIITSLPRPFPPVVVSLHIPPGFSTSLASRLDQLSELTVREAINGENLQSNTVYFAPGNYHLRVLRAATGYRVELNQEEKVNRHRPSVDLMFSSVAQVGKPAQTLAMLLTGMGKDGAQGLLELHQMGATTWAQDEASSVVWGMPGAAVRMQAVCDVVALGSMASRATEWVNAATARRGSAHSVAVGG